VGVATATLPSVNHPHYQLGRRLGGPHSRPGRCGGKKNLPMPEIEHRFLIQLLRFWTSSNDLFLFIKQRFGDRILSRISGGTFSVGPNR
jgi:hypothetical protein